MINPIESNLDNSKLEHSPLENDIVENSTLEVSTISKENVSKTVSKKKRCVRSIDEHIEDMNMKIERKEANIKQQQKELAEMKEELTKLYEKKEQQTVLNLLKVCKEKKISLDTIVANLDIFIERPAIKSQ